MSPRTGTLLAVVLAVLAPPATAQEEDAAGAGSATVLPEQQPKASGPTMPDEEDRRKNAERHRKRARLVPHYEYLEDSYVDYTAPDVGPVRDAPLMFEAQAATHLFVFNNWHVVERPTNRGAMANVLSADVSFVIHLRMVQDDSAPVRPPSYMPGAHLQWFGLWKVRLPPGETSPSGSAEWVPPPWVLEAELETAAIHHSNGQQQCTFAQNVRAGYPGGADCLTDPLPSAKLKDQLNYRSGDFSTTYAQVGGHAALITLDRDRFMKTRTSAGLVYQQHMVDRDGTKWVPGGMSPDQAWLYGIHRLKLEAQFRLHMGSETGFPAGVWAFTFAHERMWNTALGLGIPNHRTMGEVSFTLDCLHGAGLFARGTSGQDDLNVLYLAGRTEMLQVGIIWNTATSVRYLFGEGRGIPVE